jgi:hypothetical protein
MGAVAGSLFLIVRVALLGDLGWLAYPEAYGAIAFTGLAGAALTTGMVTMAKRARRHEIATDPEARDLVSTTAEGRPRSLLP